MRIQIHHEIVQTFDPAAKGLIESLRLAPRSHEGQHVIDWRIDVEANCRLRRTEDAFGNFTDMFSLQGPVETLRIVAEGVIETFDCAGVVRNSIERFPPELFLRDTNLTAPDAALRALGASVKGDDKIERLHGLLVAVREAMQDNEDGEGDASGLTAAQALAAGKGGARDLAHVFVASARAMGAPARFVSGHYLDDGKAGAQCHSWAEAYVEKVGWIGFDPVHCICPHESHVRIACGLDWLDAGPVRAASPGAIAQTMAVIVRQSGFLHAASAQLQGQQ
jgi:transglutaminase-like putative cysteine protease